MTSESALSFWLIVWLSAAGYVLVRHWIAGRSCGLAFTYVVSFGAIHWLAAALYMLPWFTSPEMETTVEGLRVSAIAMVAFAAGGEIGAALFRRRGLASDAAHEGEIDSRVATVYILAGAMFYGVIFPVVAALPTASALASTASSLMVLGVAFKAWIAWRRGRIAGTWFWLAATVAFPIITLIGQGFLGFGFAAMVVVAAFVASFYRPRWQVVVAGVVVAYLGLSVYVTYMRDRGDIRQVVWGGEAMGSRVDRLTATFRAMEWFDVYNLDHLHRVDERLNQDALVGMAVENIDAGVVPRAHGRTMWDAALALVPRTLWPNKPVIGGSGDLVSDFTGLVVPEGTSVGIGHVMEYYVNFGLPGVVLGFLLLGAVIVYVDHTASVWLVRGDASRFAIWFLPGSSLLQVGGSFAEMTSSAAAAFIMAWALSRAVNRLVPSTRTMPAPRPSESEAS